MKVLLWLDDNRNPQSPNWIEKYAPEYLNDGKIVWVKNYDEFVDWVERHINRYGLPDMVAFDHDLADEHYRASMYDEDEHYSDYYTDGTFTEKTGYDAAKWLVDFVDEHDMKFPKFVVQSANPIGKKNIIKYIENAKKILDI